MDCIEGSWDTGKVRNTVAQDRGFRRRLEGERKAANELKVRAQLYRFVIGSVLDDTRADHSSRGRELPSPVESLWSVGELGATVSPSSVDVLAEAAIRDTSL